MKDYVTGKVLVSPPNIIDRRFANTVIYIVDHSEAGAWGVVLNRPSTVNTRTVLEKLHLDVDIDGLIHAGGPVDGGSLNFLHTADIISSESYINPNGVCVSNDMEFIGKLHNGSIPKRQRVFAGRCMWAPGQLEGELEGSYPWSPEHSWMVIPATPELIFGSDDMSQWQDAVNHCARLTVSNWMA